MKYLIVLLSLLSMSGCGWIFATTITYGTNDATKLLQSEYAKYVIKAQESGIPDVSIICLDEWVGLNVRTSNVDQLYHYGWYYSDFMAYPELNKGKPLKYKEWIQKDPWPSAVVPDPHAPQTTH